MIRLRLRGSRTCLPPPAGRAGVGRGFSLRNGTMIDTIGWAEKVRDVVASGEKRKYHRFRSAFAEFEEEDLILYPFVIEHLREAGLFCSSI